MKTIKSLKYLQQITVLRNSSSFSNLKKIACKEGFLLQSTQEDSSFKKDAIDVTSSESVRERSAFYTAQQRLPAQKITIKENWGF